MLLLGAPWWPAAAEDWPKMIPTITLLSTLPPMALLVLKGALVLPPISCLLSRVRSGGDSMLLHSAQTNTGTLIVSGWP